MEGNKKTLTLWRVGAPALLLMALLTQSACKSSGDSPVEAVNIAESSGGSETSNPVSLTGSAEPRAMTFGFYEFVPTATHADGEDLAFSITGKPAWAAFDSETGTLSGIPQFDDVGMYTNVSISASDGTHTSSLNFSIEVYVPPLTSTTVAWLAPLRRLDGTVLDDLAGFSIHYGTSPYRFPHVVRVGSPAAVSHFLENIPANRTYYFSVKAYDVFEKESPYSDVVEVSL